MRSILSEKLLKNKTIKQTITKNTFWLFLAEGVNKGTFFLISIAIARYAGVSNYGSFAFSLAFVSLFSILADFGLSLSLIKEISGKKKITTDYMSNMLILRVLLGVASFFIIYLVSRFAVSQIETREMIYLLGIYIILTNLNVFFRSFFKAKEKMEYEAASQLFMGLILALSVAAFAIMGYSIYFLIAACIFSAFIGNIFTIFLLRGDIKHFKLRIKIQSLKEILRTSKYFFLSTLFVYAYYYIDALILYFIKGEIETGVYSAAYKLLTLLIAPVSLYLSVLFPTLSKNFKRKQMKEEIKKIIKKNIKILFLGSTALTILLVILSEKIILFIYGIEYMPSVRVLQLLIASWFLLVNYSVAVICLQAFNLQKKYVWATFIGAVSNIILNMALIPKYSVLGAAMATIITELIVGQIVTYYFIKYIWWSND